MYINENEVEGKRKKMNETIIKATDLHRRIHCLYFNLVQCGYIFEYTYEDTRIDVLLRWLR